MNDIQVIHRRAFNGVNVESVVWRLAGRLIRWYIVRWSGMKVKSSSGYLDQEKLEHPFIHVLCIVQRDIAAKEVGEEVAEIKMLRGWSRVVVADSPACFFVRMECVARSHFLNNRRVSFTILIDNNRLATRAIEYFGILSFC